MGSNPDYLIIFFFYFTWHADWLGSPSKVVVIKAVIFVWVACTVVSAIMTSTWKSRRKFVKWMNLDSRSVQLQFDNKLCQLFFQKVINAAIFLWVACTVVTRKCLSPCPFILILFPFFPNFTSILSQFNPVLIVGCKSQKSWFSVTELCMIRIRKRSDLIDRSNPGKTIFKCVLDAC